MKSHKTALLLLVAASLLLAWNWARPDTGWVDLGGGLLMRADGSVLAAWEVPECAFAGDLFEVPEHAGVAMLATPERAWRVRLDRGW